MAEKKAKATREQLQALIAELESRLVDLQRRLPAHSVPPAMIAELDKLDEELAQARARLKALGEGDRM